MTVYLFDTPVLLTFLSQKDGFSHALHTVLADKGAKICASSANIFEVAVKKALKRIRIPDDFPAAVRQSGLDILPIDADQAWKTLRLPFHHPDPFDRLLIAQAKIGNLTLLTRNPVFQRYDVSVQMV